MGVRRLERRSRRLLDRLHDQVGGGLLAARTQPGLAAVVDQHAAAVRDILLTITDAGAAAPVLLAGYARGVLDHVRERGGQVRTPADTAGWARADWVSVRLVAVCALARATRTGNPLSTTTGLPSVV